MQARYKRLIQLLETRRGTNRKPMGWAMVQKVIKQCEFVISPVPMPHLFIIGDRVAYEGMKRGGSSGFGMTHCENNPDALKPMIEQFDRFFASSREDMILARPPDGQVAKQLHEFYEEAMRFERKYER